MASRAALPAFLLIPGALVVGLGFADGGYFPGPPALAAVLLALLLVGRLTLARQPLAGISGLLLCCGGALALLAAWTLVSSSWSGAPGRALAEYHRVLLYLLAVVVFGTLGRSAGRIRWLVRGVLVGLFALCVAGFLSRTFPDVFGITPRIEPERLSYPLKYWNAVGITASLGAILAFGLSGDGREHPAVRVVCAAMLPLFAATLLFTLSRGAMGAGAAGLIATVLLGRSRLLLCGLVAAVPVAVAVMSAYGAELLTSEQPTGAAAAAQGHEVAVVVGLCMLACGGLRALLLLLDRRLQAFVEPPALRRPAFRAAAAGVLVCAAGALAIALGVPEKVDRQYERFVAGDAIEATGDRRDRLTDPGNNGRLHQWRVAVDGARSDLVRGVGAGTYRLLWDRDRPERYQVEDAHSLYIEMLAELGIVGLILLLVALGSILGGLAWRARGADRMIYAMLFGAGLAWMLHAGVDWLWEMPATGVWLFAAAGLALAAPAQTGDRRLPQVRRLGRLVAALCVLLVAVTPARMVLSEEPLRDASSAFASGDCARAVDRSLDSLAMLAQRPEPFEIVGYCDVRLGYTRLAVRALENAVERDPGNWEYHYGLALARGAAGLDPRAQAAEARRLNPLSEIAAELVLAFADGNPRTWRRRALAARLPVD